MHDQPHMRLQLSIRTTVFEDCVFPVIYLHDIRCTVIIKIYINCCSKIPFIVPVPFNVTSNGYLAIMQKRPLKIDQLMSLALLFAQHVSDASTFIFRSLQLCVDILLWFDVCWCYGVVRLGWCGILMQAEALVPPPKPKPSQPNKILIILGLIIKNNIETTNIKTKEIKWTIFKSPNI